MTLITRLRSLVLAGVLLSFLPLTVGCLCLHYAIHALTLRPTLRSRLRRNPGFQRRKILITGVSTPQGLRLARAFFETGHNVVGAETGHKLLPSPARFSTSFSKYRQLTHSLADEPASEYILEILDLVQKYNVELWIDCSQQRISSNLRQAKSIIERRSRCLCFLPSDSLAPAFASPDAFLTFTRGHGLPAIDNHQVRTRGEIHNVLNDSRGKKRYLLSGPGASKDRALLPRRTPSQTYNELSRLKIQKDAQWTLKQHVEGQEKYTTTAIVVKGEVKAFAASPISLYRDLQALPAGSALNKALMNYAQSFCSKAELEFSGHLSMDFCAEETSSAIGVEKKILPVDGRTGPGAPLLLFQGVDGSVDLARSYLAMLLPTANGATKPESSPSPESEDDVITPSKPEKGVYTLSYDILQLVILPLFRLLTFRMSVMHFVRNVMMLLNHVVFWQESVYNFQDPLPFWWLYQVYVPASLILSALRGRSII